MKCVRSVKASKDVSRWVQVFVCVLALAAAVCAHPESGLAQAQSEARPSQSGAKRQLATILYSGLGGAVLGLSTLSFYGRPQDKLVNIAIGFAVGVMAGTTYVTYNAATNPSSFYGDAAGPAAIEALRESFVARSSGRDPREVAALGSPISLSYRFEF